MSEANIEIKNYASSSHFTIIKNALLRNKNLSWKATGLLCYMLSMADGWSFNLKHLSHQKTDGERSTRAGLQELENSGYLYIEKERGDHGEFVKTIWHITDDPENASWAKAKAKSKIVAPAPTKTRPAADTKKPIPPDFKPGDSAINLAKDYGLNINQEITKFIDYYTGVGSQYKDWQSIFKSWLHKANDFKAKTQRVTKASSFNKNNGAAKAIFGDIDL
ncbi:hypothetical protein J1777_06240 [Comamonas denitrificans]|uniref:Uncharacterized protein n=1 Tax=Comamonas denitrificans TaxID=117506 RepID=A0A939KBF3_9BURK|nr:hypothetical protein [Comamonas denitrificans]MBO1249437.1 hypothetical protein [Comamonas denitrificans]